MEGVTSDPIEREALRNKGQFFTPEWVTSAMAHFILQNNPSVIYEPGFGTGAFYYGLKDAAEIEKKNVPTYLGCETDKSALDHAKKHGLNEDVLSNIKINDFLKYKMPKPVDGIIGNPPYIRHHRIDLEYKKFLSNLSTQIIGKKIDGRAGLHVYFLIKSLTHLSTDGRLSFILPADVTEGKYSTLLWEWITNNYQIDSIVTFHPEKTPFPGVDTNAMIFNIINSKPKETFDWIICNSNESDLAEYFRTRSTSNVLSNGLTIIKRTILEGKQRGFSRPPTIIGEHKLFSDFAKCMRGIATGANDYFWLTKQQIIDLNLPEKYFIRAVGRTRDVKCGPITKKLLNELDSEGKPTFLLNLNGEKRENFPASIETYISHGEDLNLHKKPLISTRNPWYKMEKRKTPQILFSYLGRRANRFISNEAKVTSLTGFLCVYPIIDSKKYLKSLLQSLNHPKTIEKLSLIGKSYGKGSIKVEPRMLDNLPITLEVARETGLYEWWDILGIDNFADARLFRVS